MQLLLTNLYNDKKIDTIYRVFGKSCRQLQKLMEIIEEQVMP